MRILQVIDTLNVGGAERITVMLSNLLSQNNIDISLIVLVEDGPLINHLNSKIEIFRLKRKKRFQLSKMREFARILKQYDIAHVHLKHNFRYTSIVSKIFGLNHVKIILHDHSHSMGVSKFSAKYLKDSLFKNILRPRHYIGVSSGNIEWAMANLKMDINDCYILPNIIVKKDVENRDQIKKGIVLVSNISKIKNLEFAIDLIAEMNENLTIYGRIIDQHYYDLLEERIANLGLQDKIKFIFDCHEIQNELNRYKLAIHTAHKETGPLVLIEYLAHGLPFLSYSSGEVYNKIGNELPEFFISSFEINNWIEKINQIFNVPKNRMILTFENNYSTVKYMDQCLKIYKSILNY